jgi:hypothetical protein
MIVGGCVRLFTRAVRQKNIHCKIVFVTIRTPNRGKAAARKKVVRSQIKIKAANELSLSLSFSLSVSSSVGREEWVRKSPGVLN